MRTVRSQAETYRPVLELAGETRAARTGIVSPRLGGTIEALPVSQGAMVAAGEVIAELHVPGLSARLAEAEARMAEARREFDATETLAGKGLASQSDLAADRSAFASAEASLEAVRAEVADTRVTAPIAGRLGIPAFEIGERVQAGEEIATVTDLSELVVRASVPQKDVAGLVEGQAARVALATGEEVAGRLDYIAPEASSGTRSFEVEVRIPNADLSLRGGVSATIHLDGPEVAAHRVASAYLSLGEDGRTQGQGGRGRPGQEHSRHSRGRRSRGGAHLRPAGDGGDHHRGTGIRDGRPGRPDGRRAVNAMIDAAFSRTRLVVLAFVMIIAAGIAAYVSIPKESSPEIPIPTVYVSVGLDGISPSDAVTSLLKPLESELAAIEGLDGIAAQGFEGGASLTLEFQAGFDADQGLDDVRQAVGRAVPDLPSEATEPVIREVNTALFPVMTVVISGKVPERALISAAEELEDRIEGIEGVLEVDVSGKREDVAEVLIDPRAFETYGLDLADVAARISNNNRLVAAGAVTSGDGRLVMKLPGLVASASEVLSIPLKVEGDRVVTFADVAEVRRSLEDAEGYARLDGEPAISLDVKKRSGANIIETTDGVMRLLTEARDTGDLPEGLAITVTSDEADEVRDLLGDLQNNVIAAVVLVTLVVLAALGPRSAFLVALSIPGSFLSGVALLSLGGFTMNIIVLFGLILVSGMLVDGAIVVIEYADRRVREGASSRDAFADAARRMAWPIASSTATTLSVFLPLLFWQGMVGEFMKFLPITVLFTLSASLVMALVFIPVLGGILPGRARPAGDGRDTGPSGLYAACLERALLAPKTVIAIFVLAVLATGVATARHGTGVEFFPKTEPEVARIEVLSRDNLSVEGRLRLLEDVEARVLGRTGISSVVSRTGGSSDAQNRVGSLDLVFEDWDMRAPAAEILADIRGDLDTLAGLEITVTEQQGGPGSASPIAVEIAGPDSGKRGQAVRRIVAFLEGLGGIPDISDTRPLPGFDYEIVVDRAAAARSGANIETVGQAVRLLTGGVKVSSYRPEGASETVDIRIRFPEADRSLDRLEALRVPTSAGLVPLSTFAETRPVARSGTIRRLDQRSVDEVTAGVAPGVLASEKIAALSAFLDETPFDGVDVALKGEAEDQAEAMSFLTLAFAAAIVLMLMILVAQFNSIAQALLVLSAIVFSIAGVFMGLLVTGRPFGVVMGGIGIIALAGIVVNTNIVLIDSYNMRRRAGWPPLEAALRSGCDRLRPILLTTITTILGLVPMALSMSIDIPGRDISFGAPSTLWWVDLSLAIVGGLAFATLVTLFVTPACLVLFEGRARRAELGSKGRPWLPAPFRRRSGVAGSAG